MATTIRARRLILFFGNTASIDHGKVTRMPRGCRLTRFRRSSEENDDVT